MKDKEEVSALLQTLVGTENDQDTEDDDDGDDDIATLQGALKNLADTENDEDTEDDEDDRVEDIATLQGVFDMLAQVDKHKAKEMDSESASAQLLGFLGHTLWNVGKRFLRNRYCTEKETMIQELVSEQEISEDKSKEKEGKALAELQSLFNALRKAEVKLMQDDVSDDDNATVERRRRRGRRRRGRRRRGRGRRRERGRRGRYGRRRWSTRSRTGSGINRAVGGVTRNFLC